MPVPYDVRHPDPQVARRVFLDWLRANPSGQLDTEGGRYETMVEWVGHGDRRQLAFQLSEVFWEFVSQGIVAPGLDAYNLNLPWYHLTAYGRTVVDAEEGHAYDEAAYLARVRTLVAEPDATVMAYLVESVRTFRRGTPVAAAVMLGIAAERVFLLLCASLLPAVGDEAQRRAFERVMDRFPMKPKMDWVHEKIQAVLARRPCPLPDNAALATTAIYDFLRTQRNDLGHPRDLPPVVDQQEAFANLQMFPRYYQTVEALRQFFAANRV